MIQPESGPSSCLVLVGDDIAYTMVLIPPVGNTKYAKVICYDLSAIGQFVFKLSKSI